MSVFLRLCTTPSPTVADIAEWSRLALALGARPAHVPVIQTTGAPTALGVEVPIPVDPTEANLRLLHVASQLREFIDRDRTLSPRELVPVAEVALGRPEDRVEVLAAPGSRLRALVADLTRLAAAADGSVSSGDLMSVLDDHGFSAEDCRRIANNSTRGES